MEIAHISSSQGAPSETELICVALESPDNSDVEFKKYESVTKAAVDYSRTLSWIGFQRGASQIMESAVLTVDRMIPVDDYFMQHYGHSREYILENKLLLYGGVVLLAAILLPAGITLAIMAIGIGSELFRYGRGFHDFYRSNNYEKRQLAFQQGEEAFAAATLGTMFLAVSRGSTPLSRTLHIPQTAARSVDLTARSICLADDPYFLQLAVQTGAELIYLSGEPTVTGQLNIGQGGRVLPALGPILPLATLGEDHPKTVTPPNPENKFYWNTFNRFHRNLAPR